MNEERVHEILSQVAEDPAPPLGFTADAIVAEGRRGARRRRFGAVAGSAVAVLAVGAGAAALPGLSGAGRESAVGPAASHTSVVAKPDPQCVKEYDNPPRGEQRYTGLRDLQIALCPAQRHAIAALDPQGKHIWSSDSSGKALRSDIDISSSMGVGGTGGKVTSLGSGLEWTPSGTIPAGWTTANETLPWITIQVEFSAPGTRDYASLAPNMALIKEPPGKAPDGVAWTPVSSTTLPDGSTVVVKKVQNGPRVGMLAERTTSSGLRMTIMAWDAFDPNAAWTPDEVIDPFPISAAQMADAVSSGALTDVSWPSVDGSGLGFPVRPVTQSPTSR